MGVFDYAAAGFAEGVGRGLANAGTLEFQAQQQAARDELRQQDRLELLAARLATQAQGGKSRGPSVLDLAALPDDQLRRVYAMGGLDPAGAQAAVANARGQPMPTQAAPTAYANPDRQEAANVKYTEGKSEQLAKEAFQALRRAMGLGQPQAADDIAKAENTERTGGLVDRYVGSGGRDVTAGEGVLLSQGKSIRSDTSGASEITGVVPKGSTGEAQRVRDFGAGEESKAKGANAARGEDNQTLRALQQERLSIESQITEARRRISDLAKDPSEEAEALVKAERRRLTEMTKEHDELRNKIRDLSNRLTTKGSGAGGGPPLSRGAVMRFDAQGNLVK